MSILSNWDEWKNFLGDQLENAEKAGLSQDVISNVAVQVGEYLAQQVEPKNEQERVLAELWSVANKEEQQAIANMMIKLVQQR